jgi:DNA (cytosine-5)-methyltransferase 1
MKSSFRFADLFAGLGGFHIALNRMGGQCVFAAEIQPHLQDLYEANFSLRPVGDIAEIKPKDVPDHDVLTAGFPCQPFSKAGEQLGFECTKQGNLFFDVAAILKKKKPGYFILENVPNLLKHNNGKTWAQIQCELGDLGYHIQAERFSPHHFGIPQIRERVYIVGSRYSLKDFEWPKIQNTATSVETILEDHPADARKLSKQVVDCLEVWDEFLHLSPKTIELPSYPLWSMEWGATYPFESETPFAVLQSKGGRGLLKFRGSHGVPLGELEPSERFAALPSHARVDQDEFPKWKKDFIRQNRKFYLDNQKWIDPWIGKVLKFPSSLQKLEWNVKGGERDIWQYVLQFRASGVRIKRRTTAPSLIAMTDTQVPIIGWQRRYMTPRECARLQSLRELPNLPDTPARAFRALGNAVNSDVVEMVARALLSTRN